MTLRCKHCGADVTLTERESAQIIKDWIGDSHGGQQARLSLQAVCGECWQQLLGEQQADETAGRRVHVDRAAA